MKSKACALLLAACVMLSVPASAGATTFSLSGVTYTSGSLGSGTVTGTFDFSAGMFSNFDITVTGGPANGFFFNEDAGSTANLVNATNSSDDHLVLILAASLPTSPDAVTGGLVNNCLLAEFCGEEVALGSILGGSVTATPLPAALPLFATGLGGLGLLGWRRKRKARAST